MSKCIVRNCQSEAEPSRMLCSRHYAQGLVQRAKGLCIRCKERLAHNGSVLCKQCQQEMNEEASK